MYKISLAVALLLAASALPAQNKDLPVADLADQKDAAQTKHDRDVAHIGKVSGEAAKLTARTPDSLNSRGVRAQLAIKRCLANGDYHRAMTNIYAAAFTAAGQLAQGLETSYVPSASANAALAQLRQQLTDTKRQEAALEAGGPAGSVADLQELRGLETKLQEAIAAYERIPARGDQPQTANLRQMQTRFAITNQTFAAATQADNAECLNQRQVLADLAQEEARSPAVDTLSKLLSGAAPAPNSDAAKTAQSGGLLTQQERAEIQTLETQVRSLKEQLNKLTEQSAAYDQILSSIPALQERLNELRQKEAASASDR